MLGFYDISIFSTTFKNVFKMNKQTTMLFGIGLLSTWLIGLEHGYKRSQNESISASTRYGVMGTTTGLGIIRYLGNLPLPITKPASTLGAMCVIVPATVGSTFCLGMLLGKEYK